MADASRTDPPASARALLDGARRLMRARQMSGRTEEVYLRWMQRFLTFATREGSPGPCGTMARRFVEDLAVRLTLSAATRNQAASAIAFLVREVAGCPDDFPLARAKGRGRLPTVLAPEECRRVMAELTGRNRLVVALLYGSGLRLAEALNLRVKDVSFDPYRLVVRDGKGGRDRETLLPERAANALRHQIEHVARIHEADLERGHGWARMPGALDRKSPGSGYELAWQFVFPSKTPSPDPATGRLGRWHIHPTVIQRAVKDAVRRSGVAKHVTCHTFRHDAEGLLPTGNNARHRRRHVGEPV